MLFATSLNTLVKRGLGVGAGCLLLACSTPAMDAPDGPQDAGLGER